MPPVVLCQPSPFHIQLFKIFPHFLLDLSKTLGQFEECSPREHTPPHFVPKSSVTDQINPSTLYIVTTLEAPVQFVAETVVEVSMGGCQKIDSQ